MICFENITASFDYGCPLKGLSWFFFVQVVSLLKKCELKSIYLRKLFMQINWRICAKDSDYVACPESPRITTNPNVYEVVLKFYHMWRQANGNSHNQTQFREKHN